MAVRRRKRASEVARANGSQRSTLQLMMAILALAMILGLGDRFASSAAGCYGAVTASPNPEPIEKPTPIQTKPSGTATRRSPGFQVAP